MSWFKNLRIRLKLLVAFGAVLICAVLVGIVGLLGQRATSEVARRLAESEMPATVALLDVQIAVRSAQRELGSATMATDPQQVEAWQQSLSSAREHVQAQFRVLDPMITDSAERQLLETMEQKWLAWSPDIDRVRDLASSGDRAGAQRVLTSRSYQQTAAQAIAAGDVLLAKWRAKTNTGAAEIASSTGRTLWQVSLGLLIMCGIGVAIAFAVAKLIGNALQSFGEAADKVAAGDLTAKIESTSKDELGWIAWSMSRVIKSQKELAAAATRIAAGDTAVEVKMRSDGDTLTQSFLDLRSTLDSLVAEMRGLAEAGRAGDLSKRGDASHFRGAFHDLVQGINDTLDAVIRPVQEAATVLDRVAQRDLTVAVAGDYAGDHARIKEAVNAAASEMRRAISTIGENATTLAAASEELTATASQMESNADDTSRKAGLVSTSSEEVALGVQTVASGTEELSASIREIAKSAADAARVASEAVRVADETNETISKLGASSAEIGDVIRTITSIAEQTNLLALNATIEAARAGAAGRGFAVVANEVKELAKATSRATEDIGARISAIQSDTSGAVVAIRRISEIIAQIHDIQTSIAGAVEEQTATTNEISRTISAAAVSAGEINVNIGEVARAAEDTVGGARGSLQAAHELATLASSLQELVNEFDVGGHARGRSGAAQFAGSAR